MIPNSVFRKSNENSTTSGCFIINPPKIFHIEFFLSLFCSNLGYQRIAKMSMETIKKQ